VIETFRDRVAAKIAHYTPTSDAQHLADAIAAEVEEMEQAGDALAEAIDAFEDWLANGGYSPAQKMRAALAAWRKVNNATAKPICQMCGGTRSVPGPEIAGCRYSEPCPDCGVAGRVK
jgi:hypothetical protein